MVREVYICRCKLLLSYLQNPYICLPVWQLSTNKDSTNAYLHPNQALLGAQLSTFSYERYKLLKYSLLQVRQDSILSVSMTVSLNFLEYEFSGQKIQNGILSAKSSPPCLLRQKTLLSCFSCSQMKRSECRSSSGTLLHQPFSLFEYLGMVEGKAREV